MTFFEKLTKGKLSEPIKQKPQSQKAVAPIVSQSQIVAPQFNDNSVNPSETPKHQFTTMRMTSFAEVKRYLETLYEFSKDLKSGNVNRIGIKPKVKSIFNTEPQWYQFNESKLLCELFEQGFTIDAKTYLEAYLNGLDDYCNYKTYSSYLQK